MSLSVFNKDNKSHLEAETPLHFGERLGIDLYFVGVLAFGLRIFQNIAIIRRLYLGK